MCGIMGYVGKRADAGLIVLSGLRRQEYRGYDSWGMTLATGRALRTMKAVGRIRPAHFEADDAKLRSSIGIGHTRWATHGGVTAENCHPHLSCDESVAIVHNGIVENYDSLRMELRAQGHTFRSQTDSEVIAHLIGENLKGRRPEEAVSRALRRMRGTFAVIVIFKNSRRMMAARFGSPLILGIGDREYFLASDVAAFLDYTHRALFLDDNELAVVGDGLRVLNFHTGEEVKREARTLQWKADAIDKGRFEHFMQKEIFEQPEAIARTVDSSAQLESLDLGRPERVILLGCGSALYAGMVGRHMFEHYAHIPVEVEHASEFRYRNPIIPPETLVIAITQSGETLDTLEAVRESKKKGALTLGICNVRESIIARESDRVLYTQAGPEIGVASTKAFNTQLAAQFMLALHVARRRGTISEQTLKTCRRDLGKVPRQIETILANEATIVEYAREFYERTNFLYAGRGVNFGIAMEGALKLKEVSYIHAEGMSAAELKHGAIALVDRDMPCVFIAVRDGTYQKIVNNMQEVRSRGGRIITIANEADQAMRTISDHVFCVPHTIEHLLPCLTVVPLQMLAYHVAALRECDVDKPRNLAKCVTVE